MGLSIAPFRLTGNLMPRRPTANLTESDAPATADIQTVKTLLPYLWPKGQFEMRARVVIALLCLALAKGASVYVPILYKDAVDLISGGTSGAIR
jgi:ATP-binding cassette subfamily B protein